MSSEKGPDGPRKSREWTRNGIRELCDIAHRQEVGRAERVARPFFCCTFGGYILAVQRVILQIGQSCDMEIGYMISYIRRMGWANGGYPPTFSVSYIGKKTIIYTGNSSGRKGHMAAV